MPIRDEGLMARIRQEMAGADKADHSIYELASKIDETEENVYTALGFLEQRGIVKRQFTPVGRSGVYRLTDSGFGGVDG